ncbi:MAG: hypothetical protein AAB459_00285 [Patescibacteria group bacterium]|jgi:hypothetical protein
MANKKTTSTKKSKVKSTGVSKKSSTKIADSKVTSINKSFKLKGSTYIEQTRMLQILSIPIYIGTAIAAWFMMASTTFPLTLSHRTKNILASQNSTVFSPAFHVIYDIQLRYCIIATLIILALFAAASALKMPKEYAQAVAKKVNPWRWITIGITGAIFVNIVSLLNGLSDIAAIKFSSFIVFLAAIVAWQVERQHVVGGKAPKITGQLSILLAFLPWVTILGAMFGTYFYGLVRSPWYVYAGSAVFLIATFDVILNSIMYFKAKKNWKNYSFIDRNAQLTVFFAVIVLSVILISGLPK